MRGARIKGPAESCQDRMKNMRHEDIVLAATSARSYTRHWRTRNLSWNAIGKIRYLMDGAIEYMDEVTLCYPKHKFNKLRAALGFKQDSELTELVEQAETFTIVRLKDTGEMIAFMTPLVPYRFVTTPDLTLEEPTLKSEVFDVKANLLYDPKNGDKISENLRVHKKSINMKMLLKVNKPTFHAEPKREAVMRIDSLFLQYFCEEKPYKEYFGEFLYHYQEKYKQGFYAADEALTVLIEERIIPHMSSRLGIENWPEDAILKWLKNYFGARRLPYVVTEARELWLKKQEKAKKNQ